MLSDFLNPFKPVDYVKVPRGGTWAYVGSVLDTRIEQNSLMLVISNNYHGDFHSNYVLAFYNGRLFGVHYKGLMKIE
jgi:hypothetical protein